MAEKKEKVVKKKEVKKKNTTSVKLPSARRSIQRQRHMAQGKKGYEDLWKFLTGIGVVLLIAFILLGGINQRKFINTMGKWSQTIGEKLSGFIHPEKLEVTEDGIYYNPDLPEEPIATSSQSEVLEGADEIGDTIFQSGEGN